MRPAPAWRRTSSTWRIGSAPTPGASVRRNEDGPERASCDTPRTTEKSRQRSGHHRLRLRARRAGGGSAGLAGSGGGRGDSIWRRLVSRPPVLQPSHHAGADSAIHVRYHALCLLAHLANGELRLAGRAGLLARSIFCVPAAAGRVLCLPRAVPGILPDVVAAASQADAFAGRRGGVAGGGRV